MAAIKSIQRGTTTVAFDDATATATITAVDLDKTVLFFTLRKTTDNRPQRDFFAGKFTSTTALIWTRKTGSAGDETIIEWYVVEWDSGVTVQSGDAGNNEDTTITAVVLADTFIQVSHNDSGSALGAASLVKSWLNSTTNLRMEDNDTTIANNNEHDWFVVESTDFTTQAGSLAVTGTTADQTITAVTLAQTFPIMSQSTAGNANADDFLLRGHFTSITVLRYERAVSDGPDQEIRWQVVDVGDGTSVQSGTFAFADTDGQESATVTAVTNGHPVASGYGSYCGESAYTGDTQSSSAVTLDLTTSTNLQADRNNTLQADDVEWFLIDWNAAAAAESRFIRSNLQSRKSLRFDAARLASQGLISAGKST